MIENHFLNQKTIGVVGLPGSGKSRVVQSLVEQFRCLQLDEYAFCEQQKGVFECSLIEKPLSIAGDTQIWCVVDVRSIIDESDAWSASRLMTLLKISNAVVLSFVENSDLDTQAWWQRWLNQRFKDLNLAPMPVLRWFHQQFHFTDNHMQNLSATIQRPDRTLQGFKPEVYQFDVNKVVLDHLLMGLDNSRRNLNMNIVRAQAVLETLEFDCLLELEVSANRIDSYKIAQKTPKSNLTIMGFNLDKQWLEQLVYASKVG